MSTHKCITNPNMRLPKRKSPKKNNMSQLFFSKTGFEIFSKGFLIPFYILLKHTLETMSIGNNVDWKQKGT